MAGCGLQFDKSTHVSCEQQSQNLGFGGLTAACVFHQAVESHNGNISQRVLQLQQGICVCFDAQRRPVRLTPEYTVKFIFCSKEANKPRLKFTFTGNTKNFGSVHLSESKFNISNLQKGGPPARLFCQ
jgi:hypothetical protein